MNTLLRLFLIVFSVWFLPGNAKAQSASDPESRYVNRTTTIVAGKDVQTAIKEFHHFTLHNHHTHFDRNEWQLLSKSQNVLELLIPGLDLTGRFCQWWSTDTATMTTIGGIHVKEMKQSHFTNHDPWTNYYDFLPGQFACGVCLTDSGATDTFMVKMNPLGPCTDRKKIYRSGNNIVIEFNNDNEQWTDISAFHGQGIDVLAHPFTASYNLATPIALPVSSFPAWVAVTRVCMGGFIDREVVIVW